jgi:chemotaxis protein CheD
MPTKQNKSQVLPGFDKIRRSWDKIENIYSAKILPGEYFVTKEHEAIVTVLGSCVSACVRDRVAGVGGMNHFMLPISRGDFDIGEHKSITEANRYGNYAMEHLINDVLKHGGSKQNLEIKVIGGGRIMNQMANIGWYNIGFTYDYLFTEGYDVLSQDIGDIFPRKVVYYPMTGRVRVKKLQSLHDATIVKEEKKYLTSIDNASVEGDIELF